MLKLFGYQRNGLIKGSVHSIVVFNYGDLHSQAKNTSYYAKNGLP